MNSRLLKRLLLWAVAALVLDNGITQPADRDILTLSPEDPEFQSGRYYFHDYLYAFVDSTENRMVEEVAADSFQQHFTKNELWRTIAYGGDMGKDIHYVWARLTLASAFDDDQQWLACFPAGEVDLFVPLDSNRFERHRAGLSLPLYDQDLGGSYGILPFVQLTVPARETITARCSSPFFIIFIICFPAFTCGCPACCRYGTRSGWGRSLSS